MTLLISVFILFMQFLWKWVDEMVGKGIETRYLAELFFYAGLATVPLALPLSVLLSSIMTFGNLGEHYELVAMKSAGLSLMRIMLPLIVFTILLTAGAFWFSNNLIPYTNLKMYTRLYDITKKKPALNIKEGVFYNGIEGYSIRVNKKDPDGKTLHQIMIYDHRDMKGNVKVVVAEKGKMQLSPDKLTLVLELFNGASYDENLNQRNTSQSNPLIRHKFSSQTVRLDLSGFKMMKVDEDMYKDNYHMLNVSQLKQNLDTAIKEINNTRAKNFTSIHGFHYLRSSQLMRSSDSLNKKAPNYFAALGRNEKRKLLEEAANISRAVKDNYKHRQTEIENDKKTMVRLEAEIHKKFMLSFSCLVMFFIGAPLGGIIRKGGLGMPVVVSMILFIIFWITISTSEKMVKEGVLPPYGIWMPVFIFLPLGFYLTRKATSDSSLFDVNSYFTRFKKLFSLLKWKS